jgi:hypothetical protein
LLSEAKTKSTNLSELIECAMTLRKQMSERSLVPQHREQLQRQIDATDREIDRLVYELYGLTEEEIKIVEGGT